MPKSVTPIMPAKTAVPSVCRISAPAPRASTKGSTPRMKANEVMMIGRSRSWHASRVASTVGRPASRRFLADSRSRVAVDDGGGVHVVADHHDGAAGIANAGKGGERDHAAAVAAHLDLLDVADLLAEVGLGLQVHLPGAAETIEVVDVVRAQ